MIVCHCNVLSDKQILDTLAHEEPHAPRSAVQAIKCLGCAPDCGRCVRTVRKLLEGARASACMVGCANCPGHEAASAEQASEERVWLVAAE